MQRRLYLDDGKIVAFIQDDVEDTIEANKAERADPHDLSFGRKVASVPTVIINMWLNEAAARGHVVDYQSREYYDLVWGKLSDPE